VSLELPPKYVDQTTDPVEFSFATNAFAIPGLPDVRWNAPAVVGKSAEVVTPVT
jgi:hypothetical protein